MKNVMYPRYMPGNGPLKSRKMQECQSGDGELANNKHFSHHTHHKIKDEGGCGVKYKFWVPKIFTRDEIDFYVGKKFRQVEMSLLEALTHPLENVRHQAKKLWKKELKK